MRAGAATAPHRASRHVASRCRRSGCAELPALSEIVFLVLIPWEITCPLSESRASEYVRQGQSRSGAIRHGAAIARMGWAPEAERRPWTDEISSGCRQRGFGSADHHVPRSPAHSAGALNCASLASCSSGRRGGASPRLPLTPMRLTGVMRRPTRSCAFRPRRGWRGLGAIGARRRPFEGSLGSIPSTFSFGRATACAAWSSSTPT
jgi:hypothetical protein